MSTQLNFDILRDRALASIQLPGMICGKWIQNEDSLRRWANLYAVAVRHEKDRRLQFCWMDRIPKIDPNQVWEFFYRGKRFDGLEFGDMMKIAHSEWEELYG